MSGAIKETIVDVTVIDTNTIVNAVVNTRGIDVIIIMSYHGVIT